MGPDPEPVYEQSHLPLAIDPLRTTERVAFRRGGGDWIEFYARHTRGVDYLFPEILNGAGPHTRPYATQERVDIERFSKPL